MSFLFVFISSSLFPFQFGLRGISGLFMIWESNPPESRELGFEYLDVFASRLEWRLRRSHACYRPHSCFSSSLMDGNRGLFSHIHLPNPTPSPSHLCLCWLHLHISPSFIPPLWTQDQFHPNIPHPNLPTFSGDGPVPLYPPDLSFLSNLDVREPTCPSSPSHIKLHKASHHLAQISANKSVSQQ